MNQHPTPEQLRALSVAERLKLIEDVWRSLEDAPENIEVPDWRRAELDARLAAHERDPGAAKPWAEAKAGILGSLRK